MGNKVYILQYLRKGLINNLNKNANVAQDARRAQIDINLKFNVKNASTGKMQSKVFPGQKIELLGPVDVKSVRSKAICRVSPAETGDVRLNAAYRPFMEFYEEDLPWRYTPFAPGNSAFLPWMRLIAVKTEECTVVFKNGVKVARIHLTEDRIKEVFATTAELAKSAHVQIDVEDNFTGKLDEATVNALLDENPDCGISRVLCPSKLEENSQYVLLLVPTFEQGRLAALGQQLDGVRMDALVAPQADADFELPIYYKWKCTTATYKGTFKDLADELNFTPAADYEAMDANLTVDISHSGLETVSFSDEKKIDVPAALVMGTSPYDKLEDEGQDYRKKLMEHLSLNPVFDENELEDVNKEEDPWVVPPVYGARHLMTKRGDFEKGPDANVVNEVNQKLHNRIVAGMGGTVIMNNQEEFVNRAWKSIEVINSLNQMLREYYQMREVNECAKGKNNRSSIEKKTLTKQNEGLISDAALRMLQTSGIYYNNVAPDTMLQEFKNMKVEKDKGEYSSGITKDYLAKLFDPEIWKEIIEADQRHDYVSELFKNDDEEVWGEKGMADIDFLRVLFKTTIIDGKARFILREGASEKMKIDVTSVLSSVEWQNIMSTINKKSDEIDMTTIYSMLEKLKERYETFDEQHMLSFNKLGTNKNSMSSASVRPFPIHVVNPFGDTFIVPDSCYNSITIQGTTVGYRPMAIEYFKTKSDKEPSYFFIIPKSFLDTIPKQYSVNYYGVKFPLTPNRPSREVYTDTVTTYDVFITLGFDDDKSLYDKLYNQLDNTLQWMRDRSMEYFIYKIEKKKKYIFIEDNKDNPKFIIKVMDNEFETTIDNKNKSKKFKFKWMKWKKKGAAQKFFTMFNSGKSCRLILADYREVISEMLENLSYFQNMANKPTDVEISLSPDAPQCIRVSAEDFVNIVKENVKQDLEDVASDNNELKSIQQEVEKQKERIDNLLNLMPGNSTQTQGAEAGAIDVIAPDKLAEDRIKAIEEKYGVTEYNQLEDRLHDKYPVMIHPDFLDPTFFYLRELSIDYVLPAAGSLAKNSISCFYSNQAFEEAFLLGMNTEMGRELMWREYPTDQRGSYFRKFWDQTELPKKEDLKKKYYDIEDIDKWKGKLGQNHKAGKSPMLVFAIKGSLMQTYPDTDVYLQKIGAAGKPANEVKRQEMSSWLTDDTYLVGFSGIKKEDLKNYYLVFRQKPLSLQFSKNAENQNNPYGIVNPQCYFIVAAQ